MSASTPWCGIILSVERGYTVLDEGTEGTFTDVDLWFTNDYDVVVDDVED